MPALSPRPRAKPTNHKTRKTTAAIHRRWTAKPSPNSASTTEKCEQQDHVVVLSDLHTGSFPGPARLFPGLEPSNRRWIASQKSRAICKAGLCANIARTRFQGSTARRMSAPGARANERGHQEMTSGRGLQPARSLRAGLQTRHGVSARVRRLLGALAALVTCAPFLAMLPGPVAEAGPRSISMVKVAAAPQVPLGARVLGAVAPGSVQSGIVVLRPGHAAALTSFLAAVSDKSSPLFHHYLAPGAFSQRFGPDGATIAAVKSQLGSEGLRVTGVSRDGLLVHFSGSAAQVEGAFRTGIERYRLADGTIGQATTSSLRMPSSVAASVVAVLGLNSLVRAQATDVRPGPASVQRQFEAAKAPAFSHPAGSPTACTLAQHDAEISGGLTDDEIANAYGAFGLYRLGDFGGGQHIAVYELQPFLPSDIETFDTCFFGTAKAAAWREPMASSPAACSRSSRWTAASRNQDPEARTTRRPSTSRMSRPSPRGPRSTSTKHRTPTRAASTSTPRSSTTTPTRSSPRAGPPASSSCKRATQACSRPRTSSSSRRPLRARPSCPAAGDTGDDECNGTRANQPPSGQNLLSVLDPGSQPYVLSVGGSTIDDATEPALEHVWNDGAQWGAGGGGISESWAMQSWQKRVADTAGNAVDIAHGEAFEKEMAKHLGIVHDPDVL